MRRITFLTSIKYIYFYKSQEENKKTAANELSLDSVGGIFVVLIAGMGIACAISVLEFLWKGSSLERKVIF